MGKAGDFVDALIQSHFVTSAAYRMLHPNAADPAHDGKVRLRSKNVIAELNKRFGGPMKEFEVTEERLIQEAACVAFLDPADLFDEDGVPLSIQDIPEEARRTIAGIDINEIWAGPPGAKTYQGTLKKFKITDKMSALNFLAKIKQLMLTKVEVSANSDLATLLAEARGRVAKKVETFFS